MTLLSRKKKIYRTGGPTLQKARWRQARLVLLGLFVTAALALFSFTSPWSLIELRSFDYLSTLSPPPVPDDSPIVVAIDEPSMAEIGSQWPWPRALHAELAEALRAAGAKAIGFDIIFAEPATDPQNDAALAAALGPDVVLASDESFIVTPQAEQFMRTEPLADFIAQGARTGIASVHLSRDGTLRQVPDYEDGFAAELARIAGRPVSDAAGNQLIQMFGPARTYPTVSYYQALNPQEFLPPGIFKDRVVIIGLSLQNAPTLEKGGADTFATAFTVHTGHLVSGAEIQATVFDNITHDLFITRAGHILVVTAIALSALAAAGLCWRSTGWETAAITLLVLPFMAAVSFLALTGNGTFLSPAAPALAFLLVVTGQATLDYAAERRSRREITSAFSRYLSPALVERLANDPSQLKLGGERRTLTILFCDVRGFTTISEALKDDPEQLTTLINRLLTPLSEIVLESGGTIDKYIGDCLMAFWNAPLDDPDHAIHAVGAARRMLASIDVLNAELKQEADAAGSKPHVLKIGVGINTGDCVVGNMGSTRRFDYSVLGDSVNLASRLEGESKNYGVPLLIGEETSRLAGRDFITVELDSIKVKGRTTLSPVFTVLDQASPAARTDHEAFVKRKYQGELDPSDPAFSRLPTELPELARYYEAVAGRLV
ncbi:adenylate cyclase [Pararhizobium capsulatum DSM 1112]|uniref:Adenylate cyclase n=1 Tax=Pararhizobium capsulatum DSM 1112 TaxID=1121113 RepID=A0ABU0BJ76_9HYPH|nr:adenylate/guanylate cyclase domain-containing protein [Pararhizobium capsulatum]MDQ0318303.1 adenylate cyclase [Pararhizobium capsulatum DSM 1112]